MNAPSAKTLFWLAACNLLTAVYWTFDGSPYLAMFCFFCSGFTLSGSIEAMERQRITRLVDECIELAQSKLTETTSPALSASCGSAAEQLGAGEGGEGMKSKIEVWLTVGLIVAFFGSILMAFLTGC